VRPLRPSTNQANRRRATLADIPRRLPKSGGGGADGLRRLAGVPDRHPIPFEQKLHTFTFRTLQFMDLPSQAASLALLVLVASYLFQQEAAG